jgi:hypothetical protein
MNNYAVMHYEGKGTKENVDLAIKILQGVVAKSDNEWAKQQLIKYRQPIKADETFDVDKYFKVLPDPNINSLLEHD